MHGVGLRGLKLPVRLVRIMLSVNYSMETYQHIYIYITLAHPWGPWLEDTDDEPKYIGLQAAGAFLNSFWSYMPAIGKTKLPRKISYTSNQHEHPKPP